MFGYAVTLMLLKVIYADNGAVLSMWKHNNHLNCMIANDSLNAAIAWDNEYSAVSYEYYNITENGGLQNSNWKLRNTLEVGPVLDYRWEQFPSQKCIYQLNRKENYKLSASVQGKNYIFLCENNSRNYCYKVVFEQYGPTSDINTREGCHDHNKIPQEKYWIHFTLLIDPAKITISQYGSPNIVTLPDTHYPSFLVINTQWKLHSYHVYSWENPGTSRLQMQNDFSENDDICVGLLCYVYGTLKLTLLNNKHNILSTVNSTKQGEWEELKLCGNIPFNAFMTLQVDTMTQGTSKFYIADTIRKFTKNDDFRILKKKKDIQNNQCCQNIKRSEKICSEHLEDRIYSTGNSDCPSTSVGISCLSCEKIFNQTSCPTQPICEFITSSKQTICSCPSGYKNKHCKSRCNKGWYGFGCKYKCESNCEKSCNHITGMCDTESSDIKPTSLQILTNVTRTSAKISWNPPTINDHNEMYKIIYWNINSNNQSEGRDAMILETPKPFAELKNLEPYSTYLVMLFQVLPHAEDQLGNVTFITSAAPPGPVRELTIYSVSSESVEVRWLEPYPIVGLLEMYLLDYRATSSSEFLNAREISGGTSQCAIWKNHTCSKVALLKRDSNYTFRVYAKNKNVTELGPSTHVTTIIKEGAPAPPENVVYSWKENTTLHLQWRHPYIEKSRILTFAIYVFNNHINTSTVTQEQLEYDYEFQVEYSKLNITSSQNVTLRLFSCNSVGCEFTSVNILTPPRVPRFLSDSIVPNITSTVINIQIPEVIDIDGENSTLYVVITDMQNSAYTSTISEDDQILEKAAVDPNLHSWIELEYSLKENFSKEITIGNSMKNHLVAGNTYGVTLLLQNEYKNISRYSKISLEVTMLGNSNNILFLSIPIVGIIIIGIIIFIFCIYKRRKGKENAKEMLPMDHTYEELDLLAEVTDNSKVPDVQGNKYSNRIALQDLQNYVKRCLENQEFEKQYELMPMGKTQNWKCGMEPENKSKNRYKNVAAYDHTRVKLKVSKGCAVSDYINANYIDGYDVSKAYIATQGPKTNTINDFWQMVWQENVEYIIMIANITEGGKKKVEQYWPNITETNIYGNYTVTFNEILVFPEYEIKTFKVSYKDKERTVYQLHFTCWPDHGVPFYAQSLAPFLKRTITISYSKAPIVVHCSAGIGRTGTLILCDICLRMAAKTGEVDVSYNLHKLRNQRINMVDNINQYKLVHLVLLHCLIVPDCTIQCTEHMEDDVRIALSDKIDNQMKYIEDSFWQDEAMRSVSTKIDEPVIKEKNRFENIVPDKYARIALAPYPVSDASSKYINAIKVDGFCVYFRYIVTQYPLSNTVGDFWRLVDQYEISIIICLNDLDLSDESCCNFYPKLAEQMQPTPYLKVECTNVSKETYYNISTINIQNFEKAQQQRIIKIVHLNKWKYSEQYPETPTALLMAYEEMNYLGKSSNTILVACLDGTRASGLFTALCCLIDKIKMEQICDVCLAVRTVRHSRGEFVRRSEQFAFLYKCGLEYVQQFEMYSNFLSQKK